jgi:putative sterol carrier protein
MTSPGSTKTRVTRSRPCCEPKCVVEMEEPTYLCVEAGTVDAQMAFLSGKVRVTNLAEMMRYAKAFRRARVR